MVVVVVGEGGHPAPPPRKLAVPSARRAAHLQQHRHARHHLGPHVPTIGAAAADGLLHLRMREHGQGADGLVDRRVGLGRAGTLQRPGRGRHFTALDEQRATGRGRQQKRQAWRCGVPAIPGRKGLLAQGERGGCLGRASATAPLTRPATASRSFCRPCSTSGDSTTGCIVRAAGCAGACPVAPACPAAAAPASTAAAVVPAMAGGCWWLGCCSRGCCAAVPPLLWLEAAVTGFLAASMACRMASAALTVGAAGAAGAARLSPPASGLACAWVGKAESELTHARSLLGNCPLLGGMGEGDLARCWRCCQPHDAWSCVQQHVASRRMLPAADTSSQRPVGDSSPPASPTFLCFFFLGGSAASPAGASPAGASPAGASPAGASPAGASSAALRFLGLGLAAPSAPVAWAGPGVRAVAGPGAHCQRSGQRSQAGEAVRSNEAGPWPGPAAPHGSFWATTFSTTGSRRCLGWCLAGGESAGQGRRSLGHHPHRLPDSCPCTRRGLGARPRLVPLSLGCLVPLGGFVHASLVAGLGCSGQAARGEGVRGGGVGGSR